MAFQDVRKENLVQNHCRPPCEAVHSSGAYLQEGYTLSTRSPSIEPFRDAAPGRGPRGGREKPRAVLSWLLAAGPCWVTPVPGAGWRTHNSWKMSRTYRIASLWVRRDCSQLSLPTLSQGGPSETELSRSEWLLPSVGCAQVG